MAVYHKWRTVFIQVPKNASTSIHSALRNPTDDTHEHQMYIDLLANNDPEIMENYFAFGVVRNPYDRFVSCYEYYRDPNNSWNWEMSFEDLVNEFYERGKYFYTTEDIHWWPQARFLSVKKLVLVDKIIKYENLSLEWPEVVEEIAKMTPPGFSLPSSNLYQENITGIRNGKNWEDYYTPELKEKVYHLYERDFELFGYEK